MCVCMKLGMHLRNVNMDGLGTKSCVCVLVCVDICLLKRVYKVCWMLRFD